MEHWNKASSTSVSSTSSASSTQQPQPPPTQPPTITNHFLQSGPRGIGRLREAGTTNTTTARGSAKSRIACPTLVTSPDFAFS
ncbi:hypothetical protein Pmani_005760 [Petrolisthes manimaculis]|uniref:Uncharacterized protein n=1 Tax=Petrolisthes manimaculis TaxID=1843537 RepID=A0AAE1UK78_9EUCA|nr:hypothetical protein Pmani_005760 [Petrolisthes manimaculis]